MDPARKPRSNAMWFASMPALSPEQPDAWTSSAPWPVAALYGGLILAGLAMNLFLATHYTRLKAQWPTGTRALRRRPWRPGDVAWVIMIVLIAHFGAFGIIRTLTITGWLAPGDLIFATILIQSMAMHGAICFCIFFRAAQRGLRWRTAFSRRNARWLEDSAFGLVAYLAMLPVLLFYVLLYHVFLQWTGYETKPQEMLQWFAGQDRGTWQAMYLVALAVVLAPVAEELFFRGLILPAMARRMGIGAAVTVSSALFALLHMHVPSLVPLFIFSIALSLAYIHTRSIITPIVMHALFNAISLLAMSWMTSPQ